MEQKSKTKRKALGRGLDSLIPPSVTPREQLSGMTMIDMDLIEPGIHQPREDFAEEELHNLADSIKEHGIIQPILLKKEGEKFTLIAGERRWRAAQIAGLLKIPAIIKVASPARSLELSLIENIQRKELNPMEEAKAYQMLLKDFDLKQDDIAKRVGKKRSSIANYLRILRLPPKVQLLIQKGDLSLGHAKALSGLEGTKLQIKLTEEIIKRSLSVRQAERLASRIQLKGVKRSARQVDPNLLAAENDLQKALGTKVRIVKGKGAGKIEIRFYSDDELERLHKLLTQVSL